MPYVRLPPRRESDKAGLDVLYITYDGLLEPLGRSQVLGYLEGVARQGLRLHVVSFEKRSDLSHVEGLRAMEARLGAASIEWSPLLYHRRPRLLATFWDLWRGSLEAACLSRARRPWCVHARSYVAGLMALAAKLASGAKLVFDMRGFWPEERVELGLFATDGLLYRASKRCERLLLAASDHVIVLTKAAKAVLREREAARRLTARKEVREKEITVIPCCVDVDRFQPIDRSPDALAEANGLEGKLVIGNVGTVNDRYLVVDMFRFAYHVRAHRPETVFLYLTRHDPARVRTLARRVGFPEEALFVRRADPEDVPRWLGLFRLGVFFLRPSYAAKASSFTKLGEFLASGVPVVTNKGVGDLEDLFGGSGSRQRCGLLLSGLTDRDLEAAARQALPLLEGSASDAETRANCRRIAAESLSLDEGVRRYLAIYHSLAPDGEAIEAFGSSSGEETNELARVAEVG